MGITGFLIPLGVLILISVVFKKPLYLAAGISVAVTALAVIFYMGAPLTVFLAPLADTIITGIEFGTLLFGAIFFTEIMKTSGAVKDLEAGMSKLAPDKVINTLLLAWLFGSFIEGGSGFGTPALIIAPFLISYGFKPYMAICITLLANSVAVTFGAVGLPVVLGLEGVFTSQTVLFIALTGSVLALAVPFLLLHLLRTFDLLTPGRSYASYTGYAALCGAGFAVPYFLFSFLGPEYPSLLGGLAGLTIVVVYISSRSGESVLGGVLRGFIPYTVLALFLLGVKPINGTMYTFTLPEYEFSKTIPYIYTGYVFIIAAFALKALKKYRAVSYWQPCKTSLRRLPASLFTIFMIILLSKLAPVAAGGDGVAAGLFSNLSAPVTMLAVTFMGLLGSFTAGSATVSNIMFVEEVVEIAKTAPVSLHLLLALQTMGAAIGNVISFQNIAVVQAALNEKTPTGTLLRYLLQGVSILFVLAVLTGCAIHYLMPQ